MASITEFKAALVGGGARANKYEVVLQFPSVAGGTDESQASRFLVSAAQIPSSTLGVIEQPFRGRMFKIPGDRLFPEWSITVINDLDFTIRLTNLSGHKFPSGYPSRRAWLHVTITDASNVIVFESGAIDAMGKINGLESDDNPAGFETHYNTITSADQVQSYETIMQNLAGDLTYTLLEAATYRKDNRLLPAGMDKSSVPATIQPRGEAMADADFVGGSDLVHYQISGLTAGTYTVAARLNYQTMSYGFGQDLFNDVDVSQVALFKNLDDNARLRFETISSDAGSVDF